MKKLFESVGIITIICLSFLYTEKTVSVVKQYDDVMIEIKEQNQQYKTNYINAIIKDNTIIPGLKGKQINENKSYNKMKRYGEFNSSLIVYEKIKPKISLINNKDKYIISGNKNKNQISLIFLVDSKQKLNRILKILDKKKVKATFFLDINLINDDVLKKIKTKGHNVSCNMDYEISEYSFIDNKLKQITRMNTSYCYMEEKNALSLEICSIYNNYTIIPNLIITNNHFKEIKDNITSGSVISMNQSEEMINELSIIIEYIKSKGYDIVTLYEHLSE